MEEQTPESVEVLDFFDGLPLEPEDEDHSCDDVNGVVYTGGQQDQNHDRGQTEADKVQFSVSDVFPPESAEEHESCMA